MADFSFLLHLTLTGLAEVDQIRRVTGDAVSDLHMFVGFDMRFHSSVKISYEKLCSAFCARLFVFNICTLTSCAMTSSTDKGYIMLPPSPIVTFSPSQNAFLHVRTIVHAHRQRLAALRRVQWVDLVPEERLCYLIRAHC